ncbi:CYTH domain-containing protein, partial [Caldilinea sp.]|uniref:CYTH domain-containing protein n=1 Tax=Caldilinea sp. TaxID=2293560 RepID=UPI002C9A877B|nr:CYTH domain-containing protein [Caldilinea sp.]
MSTTEERPTEVEAKFTLVDAGLLRKLAKKEATIPGYRFQKAFATEQRDIYLDTPAYRLLRYGYQLRARVRDGQWLATLKSRTMGSEVGIYQRLEIEEPLA